MKNDVLKTVTQTIKNRPQLRLQYDSSMALYAKKEDEAPVHEKNIKGNFKLDIVAFFAALVAVRTLLSVLCAFIKHKKKKAAKKKDSDR